MTTKYEFLPAAIPEMPWIATVDRDHVRTMVDGEMEVFSRTDRYGGHPMSVIWPGTGRSPDDQSDCRRHPNSV